MNKQLKLLPTLLFIIGIGFLVKMEGKPNKISSLEIFIKKNDSLKTKDDSIIQKEKVEEPKEDTLKAEAKQVENKEESEMADNIDEASSRKNAPIKWWQMGIIALLIFIGIYFLIQFFKKRKMSAKNSFSEKRLREIIKEELSQLLEEKNENDIRRIIKEELNSYSKSVLNTTIRQPSSVKKIGENEVSPAQSLNPKVQAKLEKKVFYAGKPNPDSEFEDVHEEIQNESVFKLTETEGNKAEFEVIFANETMRKRMANKPDRLLYRVCNHKNSNQDFNEKIITLEKGIAEKIEGKWVVREENKALIKFE